MDFPGLPQDILLLVLSYLEAYDLLRCQLVSKRWQSFLSDSVYIRAVLKRYTHSREVRNLLVGHCKALDYSSSELSPDSLKKSFDLIATRYYHLKHCKIRTLSRYPLRALDQSGHWHPTPQWDYHESQPGGRLYHESASHIMSANRKPYLFRPSLWTYDDGFVVFAPYRIKRPVRSQTWDADSPWANADVVEDFGKGYILAVLDLETEEMETVPFDVTDRVIRNVRLKEGTLIVEWAESEPFHDLNLVDQVHRHFATIYDVRQPDDSNQRDLTKVSVTFRSEFRTHFLGLPLTARDHFFSTHTRNYYASYLWQPNRSLWTGDEDQPIEALFVWDIRDPCPYRPSEDPSNSRRNQHRDKGPNLFGRFTFRELEFLGIRQRASIALISLGIEEFEGGGNVVWKENVFVSGQGYFDPAERNWRSRITRFPFEGEGPVDLRVGQEELVAYRGSVSMESCELEEDEVEKWFLPVMDVVDRDAGVRFALLETCFGGMGMINHIEIRIKVGEDGEWKSVEGGVANEFSAMGRIAGDERWIIGMNKSLELVVGKFQ